ncbi:subtilisin-like protein [Lactarius sanguifluus]|nr:subtilisin-like protein [Lactarius sanguifluus]
MRYHWLYAISLLTATPLSNFATPLAPWGDVRVKHAWSSVPANWETLGCPSAGTTIDLYIALNPRHENALIDALYEVSDPKHPRHVHPTAAPLAPSFTYGAHLSQEQVAELVRSHPDTLELVTSWLAHHGVRRSSISTTHGGAWLTVRNVLVSRANEMLGASYQLYRHAKVNDTIIRTRSRRRHTSHPHRTLRQTPRERPVEAAAALAEVEATSGNPVTVLSSRADEVMPSQLRWMYKTFAYVSTAADRNTLGVFGFREQYPSETDLTVFMTYLRSDVQPPSLATFTVELVNGGGYDPVNPGDEANVDVQYASAMAYPTPIIFYSIGGSGKWVTRSGEPYSGDQWLESLNYLLRKTVIPQTISISYGAYERYVPREYTRALCILFAQLGARGVSVLLSTGDDGVGENCKDEFGNVRFANSFPASCPYLTAVGGTTDYDPEVAAPLSGGGFSDLLSTTGLPGRRRVRIPRAPWHPICWPLQVRLLLSPDATVSYSVMVSPEGRGIPDIAAQALMLPAVVRNVGRSMDGTSCSVPLTINAQIVAGIISLLNDYLITNGRPPLGFLNIRLYDDGFAGLNDITSGSNPGCGTDGFSAVPGWDPVTGLGTPDFEKLQNIFMTPLGGGAGQGNQPKIREQR